MNHRSRFNAWNTVLRAGALGWPWGMGWGGRWEGCSGWGTHVCPWLIHVDVWQKPLQYCNWPPIKKKKKELPTFVNLSGWTFTRYTSVLVMCKSPNLLALSTFKTFNCCYTNDVDAPSLHFPETITEFRPGGKKPYPKLVLCYCLSGLKQPRFQFLMKAYTDPFSCLSLHSWFITNFSSSCFFFFSAKIRLRSARWTALSSMARKQ